MPERATQVVNGSARRGSGLPGSPAAGGAASWQAQPAGSHFTPQSSMNLDSVSRHSGGVRARFRVRVSAERTAKHMNVCRTVRMTESQRRLAGAA